MVKYTKEQAAMAQFSELEQSLTEFESIVNKSWERLDKYQATKRPDPVKVENWSRAIAAQKTALIKLRAQLYLTKHWTFLLLVDSGHYQKWQGELYPILKSNSRKFALQKLEEEN